MKRRGIIRSGIFTFVILFAAMQLSCKEIEKKSIADEVEPEIVIPDSTVYFDSAYAIMGQFSLLKEGESSLKRVMDLLIGKRKIH
jgi:hypothetical protein